RDRESSRRPHPVSAEATPASSPLNAGPIARREITERSSSLAQSFQLLRGQSVVENLPRQLPAFGDRTHATRDEQSGARVQQHGVALRSAIFAIQKAADDFRIGLAVPAQQIAQTRGLDREMFRGET